MPTALVTGCSSGFGLLTAVELARRGRDVTATLRDPSRAGPLHDAAAAAGVDVHVEVLDVTDPDSVARAVDAAADRAGGIDVVVNNAGTEVRGPVELVADDEVRAQFDTNVFGLLHVVRATSPHLKAAGGVVVNVGSINGLIARPFAGIYAASKHAVEAITEALHFELGLFGVRVHVVEPGQFPTGLGAATTTARAFTATEETYWAVAEGLEDRVKALVPGDGPADPGDVARAIADVVDDPDAPLRTLVGGDAELIHAARHGQRFEDYEVLMRSTLDYWEGYRRERP